MGKPGFATGMPPANQHQDWLPETEVSQGHTVKSCSQNIAVLAGHQLNADTAGKSVTSTDVYDVEGARTPDESL